eukprot:COSAG01_NODE_56202_length_320_cov_0.470588_1_plen_40_part_10
MEQVKLVKEEYSRRAEGEGGAWVCGREGGRRRERERERER